MNEDGECWKNKINNELKKKTNLCLRFWKTPFGMFFFSETVCSQLKCNFLSRWVSNPKRVLKSWFFSTQMNAEKYLSVLLFWRWKESRFIIRYYLYVFWKRKLNEFLNQEKRWILKILVNFMSYILDSPNTPDHLLTCIFFAYKNKIV